MNDPYIAKITPVKKGEQYEVKGIKISHADFGTDINLITDIGEFSERDYKNNNPAIQVNKNVHALWSNPLSFLMYWPIIPIGIVNIR